LLFGGEWHILHWRGSKKFMGLPKRKAILTLEEYLAGEKDSPIRHEYVSGQAYAMAGASDRHNRIALNLASRLHQHLEGKPCEVFISDMKLYVRPDAVYYPDVMVACDPPGGDAYLRTQPKLITEVLSPSTERIDRHEKLTAYRGIPALQEYVLIEQDSLLMEIHRRQPDQTWAIEHYDQPDDLINFTSVGFTLRVSDIYRNVRWPGVEPEPNTEITSTTRP
jgi:Uma2 family endonuclease